MRSTTLVVVAWALAILAARTQAEPVSTESGLLQGRLEDGVAVHRGIPYAEPPLAEYRWHPPQPPRPWRGVRDASTFSAACMQKVAYPPDAPAERTSEDCLYLNIWSPAAAPRGALPVMVWIYGGGLTSGSASAPIYAGETLAKRGVVVVTFNYRLGVFGFLAHPQLSRESPHRSSGNFGLQDQIAALTWVQRNIAAFGGDPARVTVFGQSSGAISISALIASPLARGLFRRAIAQSGGLFEPLELAPNLSLAGAEVDGEAFVARSGAPDVNALRALPAEAVVKMPFAPALIVDGYVLAEPPYDTFRKRAQSAVDVLVGSNADEGQYFIGERRITVGNFREELARSFPALLVRLAGPGPGRTDAQARAAAETFERDMRFRWDMWTWARLAADDNRSASYLYEFSGAPRYRAASPYRGMRAPHGAELPYVFGHLDSAAADWTDRDRQLAATIADYWTNFAKTGDPNGPGLPAWPRFDPMADQLLVLGDEVRVAPIADITALRRIDRVYAGARFVFRNWMLLVGAAGLVLVAGTVILIRRTIRRP